MPNRREEAEMRTLLSLLFIAFAGVGCSPSTAVTIQSVGQSPGGSLSSGLASVPVGVVLGLQVTTKSSAVVTAAVDDPTRALVAPTTQPTELVLVGMATGQTTLRVFVDNHEAVDLPVQVMPPAP
jgi:hypothetical protein